MPARQSRGFLLSVDYRLLLEQIALAIVAGPCDAFKCEASFPSLRGAGLHRLRKSGRRPTRDRWPETTARSRLGESSFSIRQRPTRRTQFDPTHPLPPCPSPPRLRCPPAVRRSDRPTASVRWLALARPHRSTAPPLRRRQRPLGIRRAPHRVPHHRRSKRHAVEHLQERRLLPRRLVRRVRENANRF